MRQWVLSLPIPLRLRLAAQPRLVTPVLQVVLRVITRLEAGGLIKTVPQRGLQIAHMDLKLIRNAFQVRSMIEREAVLAFVQSASDAELESIEQAHQQILARASATPHRRPP